MRGADVGGLSKPVPVFGPESVEIMQIVVAVERCPGLVDAVLVLPTASRTHGSRHTYGTEEFLQGPVACSLRRGLGPFLLQRHVNVLYPKLVLENFEKSLVHPLLARVPQRIPVRRIKDTIKRGRGLQP